MSSATTDDEAVRAYYRDLCARIQTCRPVLDPQGKRSSRPPASEAHLQAVEAQLGFPIPPLLRLLYSEVADGGWGLIDAYQELVSSAELVDGTEYTGWRMHPAIERALQRQRGAVRCEMWPDRFMYIGPTGHCQLFLDAVTGWIYQGEVASDVVPAEEGEAILTFSLHFIADSLAEHCEKWLARYGCGDPRPAPSRTGWPRGHITPELIAAESADDPALVWRGLYRRVPHYLSSPGPIETYPLVELFDEQGEVVAWFRMPDVESE